MPKMRLATPPTALTNASAAPWSTAGLAFLTAAAI